MRNKIILDPKKGAGGVARKAIHLLCAMGCALGGWKRVNIFTNLVWKEKLTARTVAGRYSSGLSVAAILLSPIYVISKEQDHSQRALLNPF